MNKLSSAKMDWIICQLCQQKKHQLISVCIPTYNFDATTLISELVRQTQLLEIKGEVIVIDDFSEPKFQEINKKACSNANFIGLTKNIGRAKIRNLFLNYAHFDLILFLDGDSQIISQEFIKNYINATHNKNFDVICGGRIFPDKSPSKEFRLRWKYGKFKESQPVEKRLADPNKSFMTNNFLIKKALLSTMPFDERLTSYGHEDTLFGFTLKLKGILVMHISNPILNGDLETNEDFLNKTEKGLINLAAILIFVENKPEFIRHVTLLSYYQKLQTPLIKAIYSLLFYLILKPIRYTLKKGFISLILFDIYKLGYFTTKVNKSKSNNLY